MAKKIFPTFWRDQHAGSLEEFLPAGPEDNTPGYDPADPFRVLVAFGDETDREITIQQLGQAVPAARRIFVECAADGAAALESIRRNPYELIVLNWNLPHPAGAETLCTIREHGRRVPIVVVSGQPREVIARELELTAAAFVPRNEMNVIRFRNAIVASILLLEGAFGLVRSGFDTLRI